MTEKARILFIDDEKRVLNAMRGLLRREYELFLTSDGPEAIRLVQEHDIDVIVADQRMPGMTGIEVLGKVKQCAPRTVRILLTGYADPGAVEGSINIGEVFRFLSKPCPPQLLRETLTLAVAAARTSPVSAAPVTETAPEPSVQTEPEPAQAPQPARAPEPPQPTEAVVEVQPAAVPPPAAALEPPIAALEEPPVVQAEPPVTAQVEPFVATHVEPPQAEPETTLSNNDDTEPALPILDETDFAHEPIREEPEAHWQTVTNVVMSEDTVEETVETLGLGGNSQRIKDVGIVVFTIDSDFASAAIRAFSADRNLILATTLVKVAHAIEEQNAGVLVTDFTSNSAMLQKMVGALKQRMPELVTIVASNGRDTTDMINLINYGQIFRYVLKPIEPEQLRNDINAAVLHHLYLLSNPDSAKRHEVIETPGTVDSSKSLNRFLGKFRRPGQRRADPTDTIA